MSLSLAFTGLLLRQSPIHSGAFSEVFERGDGTVLTGNTAHQQAAEEPVFEGIGFILVVRQDVVAPFGVFGQVVERAVIFSVDVLPVGINTLVSAKISGGHG